MFVCFLMTSAALAVNIGKISGKVVDRETGEPLPTVAVSIAGTNMGALTDVNGQYIILNVPVGTYDIKAELVGYQPIEQQGIFVSVDLTRYVDFELTSRAIDIGEVQVVQAERPLIITDQTSTLRLVSGEEVRNMPTDDYQDVISLSTGVVAFNTNTSIQTRGGDEASNNPTLNIRGGRQNEVAYYIDGFDTKDPLTGTATTTVNNNAIEEVSITTGGFNAEYGWIASGAINVSTKEGAKAYSGSVEGISSEITDDYGYNTFRFDLAGPIFPDNEKISFFVSGERRTRLDREPHATNDGEPLGHNDLRGWTWQGKLRYDITNSLQLRFGVLGSIDKWNQYIRSYAFDLQHAPRYEDKNNSFYLQLTHNLSKETFYTLKGNYFQTSRFQGDAMYMEDIWSYIRPTGNPTFDDTRLYRSYDDPETHYQACCPDLSWCSEILGPDDLITDVYDTADIPCDVEDLEFRYEYALNYDTDDDDNFVAVTGDSTILNEDYVFDDFTKRKSSYYGLDFDLTHQINSNNEVKIGFEYQRHTLRYIRHATPASSLYKGASGGGLLDIDNYGYEVVYQYDQDSNLIGASIEELDNGWNAAKNPYTFALYLQDKFEWEGLVVNAGLRFDYLNVNTQRLINEDNPLDPFEVGGEGSGELTEEDLEDAEAETRLSPRLGIGFPITDKTVFHLYYGKFFQRPELQYLYVSYDYLGYMVSTAPYYNPIGNPNLEPEETTAYEVGITHQLGDNTRFDLTAYYKDVKNLTEVLNQPATPFAFATYRNQDFGTIKGVELALKMRRSRNIAMDLAYTMAYANGTGSYATTQQNIAWTNSERPLRVSPLEFDQRHKITAVVDVRSGRGEGPRMGEVFPLENAGLNMVFSVGSGTPYSPMEIYDEVTLASVTPTPTGSINSRYGPWTYRLDLKANKMFKIADLNLDFYVWVLNVFDTENAIDVYEGTGDPNNTGWLSTDPGREFIETFSDPDPITGLTGEEKYQFKQRDPRNYDTPRQIRIGARLSF
jgi:outer membrane receptor protein involved in Fe transport